MAGFWSVIGQLQMFTLLLLTNTSIPYDVKHVVTGFKFAVNFASYIDFKSLRFYNSVFSRFDFSLTDQRLEAMNIQSDSSIYNISATAMLALAVLCVHCVVVLLYLCASACSTDGS